MARSSAQSSLAQTAARFWNESRQPLTSLAFIAPLLAVYEAGILLMGPQAMRNGAEAWLRYLLDWLGFGQYFLLPLLTMGILLAWHYTTRHPWRVSGHVLYGMAVECVLLAFCLRGLLQLQGTLLQLTVPPLAHFPADAWGQGAFRYVRTGVAFLGAGIYEELLFRLVLLSLLGWGLRALRVPRGLSFLAAIVLSSLAFSAAHYIGVYGEPIHWFSFLFRFIAGLFFALLFVNRGFGIAAGTHAGFDILVGLC
jgi:membrane protease YdiL (CAAX protease family)